VFQADQKRIDGQDMIVDFDEVLREEAADRSKVAFGHRGPQMLFEVDDFDRHRSRITALRETGYCECDGGREKKERTHVHYVSVSPPTPASELPLVGSGLSADLTNGSVDDGVKKLTMVCLRLGLDVFAGASARIGVIRKGKPTCLCGDLRELLDNLEEGCFVPAGKLPTIRHRAREYLLSRPVVRTVGVGRRRDGRGGWLLGGRSQSRGGESNTESNSIYQAHGNVPFQFESLVRPLIVVFALVLSGLADNCTDTSPGRSADESPLQATAEDGAQDRAPSSADKSALAGSDAALIGLAVVVVIVVVVVVGVAVVVVVAAVSAVPHAIVIVAIVMILCDRGKNVCRK
jgi:hypothetical protein